MIIGISRKEGGIDTWVIVCKRCGGLCKRNVYNLKENLNFFELVYLCCKCFDLFVRCYYCFIREKRQWG